MSDILFTLIRVLVLVIMFFISLNVAVGRRETSSSPQHPKLLAAIMRVLGIVLALLAIAYVVQLVMVCPPGHKLTCLD
jgi:hypothetical protein